MSDLECLGKHFRSLRYARDFLTGNATTRPWWSLTYPDFLVLTDMVKKATHPERERVIPAPKLEAPNV